MNKRFKELVEYLDKPIDVGFDCANKTGRYVTSKKDTICKFKTSKGNIYIMQFIISEEPNTILINNKSIVDISTSISTDKKFAYVVSPVFTIEGRDIDTHDKETFQNEEQEVFNSVSGLFKKYIEQNKEYNIFLIGKDTDPSKIKAYQQILKNQYPRMFTQYESSSETFKDNTGEAYYFVKK